MLLQFRLSVIPWGGSVGPEPTPDPIKHRPHVYDLPARLCACGVHERITSVWRFTAAVRSRIVAWLSRRSSFSSLISASNRSNDLSRSPKRARICKESIVNRASTEAPSYTHLRAHETPEHLVCRLLLEKKKK